MPVEYLDQILEADLELQRAFRAMRNAGMLDDAAESVYRGLRASIMERIAGAIGPMLAATDGPILLRSGNDIYEAAMVDGRPSLGHVVMQEASSIAVPRLSPVAA